MFRAEHPLFNRDQFAELLFRLDILLLSVQGKGQIVAALQRFRIFRA